MKQNKLLEWAKYYVFEQEFSVIPVNFQKKPTIDWKGFQTRKPTEQELKNWFETPKYPGIGIVTGHISNIVVIDIDDKDQIDQIKPYIPEKAPIVLTPTKKGYHVYLRHPGAPMPNSANIPPGSDFRGDGGYVVAPPTLYLNGEYIWKRPIDKAVWSFPTQDYIDLLREASHVSFYDEKPKQTTAKGLSFKKGTRDDDLFHVANSLQKGSMSEHNIKEVLLRLATSCNPSFSEKEANIKVESALKRDKIKGESLNKEIKTYINSTFGWFSGKDLDLELGITNRIDKQTRSRILSTMVKSEEIVRAAHANNIFKKPETDLTRIDFTKQVDDSVPMWLPFDIHEKIEIYSGNIILIAGSPNAGKTALLFNIIWENMNRFDIHYFNSEMGDSEMQKRLLLHGNELSEWNFKAYERSGDFHEVLETGKNKINIIDFLEIHDNFWKVGEMIKNIHDNLNGAIAIIALQKNPNSEVGLGGFRTLEKPRLALAVDSGILKIVKAKNWKTLANPNGMEKPFKIVQGIKLIDDGPWTQDSGHFGGYEKK